MDNDELTVHNIDDVLYVTPADAISTLGIPRSTLYHWCRSGKVATKEVSREAYGTKYLVDLAALYAHFRVVHLGEKQ